MGNSSNTPPPIAQQREIDISNDSNRSIDITIYGATGFVARHICHYLITVIHQLNDPSRKNFRITLAGRNEGKLQSRLSELREYEKKYEETSQMDIEWDIFIADCEDVTSLTEMAKRTVVVINCAGPYTTYGTNVVEACSSVGSDYVDITAEVEWVSRMRRQFGPLAEKSGSRIISFCGFDSIPSDLSVYAAIKEWKNTMQQIQSEESILNVKSARTWHSVIGMLNGGSLLTALQMPVNVGECLFDENKKLRPFPFLLYDPFSLIHPDLLDSPSLAVKKWKYISARSEWMNNFLTFDPEMNFAASIPFFMAVLNNKVIHASAVALKYSPILDKDSHSISAVPFTYKERMAPISLKLSRKLSILSVVPALLILLSITFVSILFKIPYLGELLANWILPPGSGSPDAVNELGRTEVLAIIQGESLSTDGDNSAKKYPDRASCHIRFEGDPGNLVTAQCAGESALCLVLNRSDLPKRSKDGFGTPAELLGDALLERLSNTKVRPVSIETKVWTNGDKDAKEGKVE